MKKETKLTIFYFILTILTLKEVKGQEPGEGGSEDQSEETMFEDGEYAKFVVTAVLFVVILGPPVTYYCTHFYSKHQTGFLRITSLFYWVIFWIFAPFTIACTSNNCGQFSKTQRIFDLFGFILMPLFWIVFQIDSWVSHERVQIAKLKITEPVLKYIDRLKNQQPCVKWSAECYHYGTRYGEYVLNLCFKVCIVKSGGSRISHMGAPGYYMHENEKKRNMGWGWGWLESVNGEP